MALPTRPNFGNSEADKPKGRVLPTQPTPFPRPAPAPIFQTGQEDVEEQPWGDEDETETFVDAEEGQSEHTSAFNDGEDYDDEIEEELAALSDEVQASVELLIEEILSDESSEVILNGPDSIHCKRNGQRFHLTDIDFKDVRTYHHVINKFILEYTDTKERITDTAHIVEGQLELGDGDRPPMVARVHVITPPVVKFAKVTIAKKARKQFTLEDIFAHGAMSQNMYEFVKAIARGKLTTVLSGLSGSGKTTLLEAMSYYFDKDDRLVVAEDTPELRFPIADAVYMVSTKPKPGDATNKNPVSLEWLVEQANRMRPDRIIIGETRGAEMAEFLVAANSGADGSMTTLHAQDPERAWMKMANLASKASSGGGRSENSIVRDIAGTIQVIIQTALIDGKHIITHITEVSNTVSQQTGKIALNPIFVYERRSGTWATVGRPSPDLKDFMAARDVSLPMNLFQK